MSNYNELNHIKNIVNELDNQRVANFGYTDAAFNSNLIEGVTAFAVERDQNVPVKEEVGYNKTILWKGIRTQAASLPRKAWNHFIGRMSYNLNKLAQYTNRLVSFCIASFKKNCFEYDPNAEYAIGDCCYIFSEEDKRTVYRKVGANNTVPPSGDWVPVYDTVAKSLVDNLSTNVIGWIDDLEDEMNDQISPIRTTAYKKRRTATIVIGCETTPGITEDDCDYFCTGTDHSLTINTALNDNRLDTGGTVVFLPGSYNITQISIAKNNVCIEGYGAIIEILKNVHTGTAGRVQVSGSNVKVEGVSFLEYGGDNDNQFSCISILGNDNSLKNCTIKTLYNSTANLISVDGKNVCIDGCLITTNSNKLFGCITLTQSATGGTIKNNKFTLTSLQCAHVIDILSDHNFITNNYIENTRLSAQGMEVFTDIAIRGNNNFISYNTILSSAYNSLAAYNSNILLYGDRNSITNNTLKCDRGTSIGRGSNVEVQSNTYCNTFLQNTCWNAFMIGPISTIFSDMGSPTTCVKPTSPADIGIVIGFNQQMSW